MKQYLFAYYTSNKPRTHTFAAALAEGAKVHGDVVVAQPQSEHPLDSIPFDGAAVMGMGMFAKRALKDYTAAGKHCLLFDKGYMLRSQYMRVSVDSWQPLKYFQRFFRSHDRLNQIMSGKGGEAFKIEAYKPHDPDKRILIAGVCQAHSNFHDLGNTNDYHTEVYNRLRPLSARKIVYRPNPSWYTRHHEEYRPIDGAVLSEPATPFRDELLRSHFLVTHGSSAAFVALASGVPIMVLGEGIARPMAMTEKNFDEGSIHAPFFPSERDRMQFFADVAYCQWTHEEYRSGEAWASIRMALAGLEKEKDTVITTAEQYREMHKSDRYFKGTGTVRYLAPIGKLVVKCGSHKLLDYGSGKGDQYKRPYNLDKAWEVNVTCYDPGVPEFSQFPSGTFDGVICCDVLEHVPEEDVQRTLIRIFSVADQFVFLSIATVPAKKSLPDGRNVHLTVKPKTWWDVQIDRAIQKAGRPKTFVCQVVYEDGDE